MPLWEATIAMLSLIVLGILIVISSVMAIFAAPAEAENKVLTPEVHYV